MQRTGSVSLRWFASIGGSFLLSVEAEEVYKDGVALRAVVGHFFFSATRKPIL